jgi:hypothetical protein
MRLFRVRLSQEAQIAFMRQHLLECADLIDELRAENEQLRHRGDRMVEALDKNDGTLDGAWRVSDAVAGWREYCHD